MLHVALYHPAIPQNTGNIARTTVGLNATLHLIHPMSFQLDEHKVRRAGLDYWPHVRLIEHADDDAFLHWLADPAADPPHEPQPWLVTKFGNLRVDQPAYRDGDVLILGNENTGLPDPWHTRWPDRRITLPMPGSPTGNVRSYNLASAAAVALTFAHCRLHP
jgi:tRNA (cytidine/uridine-2'-O-)-methyltransferase